MTKVKTIIDISDAKVSRDPGDVLVTYSLGSCIGVSVYDPVVKTGGLMHYQLPMGSLDPEKAKRVPFMFADTGMAILIAKMVAMGSNTKRMKIKVAGGASMQTGPQGFDIGKRNHLAIRKILWQQGLFIDGEDVGGGSPRNMYLDIETGVVIVRSNSIDKEI